MDMRRIAGEAVYDWHANQDPVEAAQLLELIEPGSTVVEIGCDRGGMLWAYRRASAGRVIGIDLPAAGWGSGLACDPHGATMIVGDSHEPSTLHQLKAALDGGEIDFLFIDGDHTFEGVSRDYRWYRPMVRTGGIVAFHDICSHFLFPDLKVEQLWWDVRRDHPKSTWEIINRQRPWGHGMGIGVLRCD